MFLQTQTVNWLLQMSFQYFKKYSLMCLYGSIHSSYYLTHEMVIMYLLPTLFVHGCCTSVWVIKYNSPQHAPVPKWHGENNQWSTGFAVRDHHAAKCSGGSGTVATRRLMPSLKSTCKNGGDVKVHRSAISSDCRSASSPLLSTKLPENKETRITVFARTVQLAS